MAVMKVGVWAIIFMWFSLLFHFRPCTHTDVMIYSRPHISLLLCFIGAVNGAQHTMMKYDLNHHTPDTNQLGTKGIQTNAARRRCTPLISTIEQPAQELSVLPLQTPPFSRCPRRSTSPKTWLSGRRMPQVFIFGQCDFCNNWNQCCSGCYCDKFSIVTIGSQ